MRYLVLVLALVGGCCRPNSAVNYHYIERTFGEPMPAPILRQTNKAIITYEHVDVGDNMMEAVKATS